MVLIINGINEGVTWNNLFCPAGTLESALDRVTGFVESGLILFSVQLRDNGSCLNIPVEVFDGQPFTPPIAALQTEWQQVLAPPGGSPESTGYVLCRYVGASG